jgi:cysteine desulfurase
VIYLDHAATTPLRHEALEAMLPYLTEAFGNPSSPHTAGRRARAALDDAHDLVARALGVQPREIVFTSGGTEAINLALKGAAWAGKGRGHRIVTSGVEHHAVRHALAHVEKFGFEIVEVPVDGAGSLDPDGVEAALNDRTILVSLLLANNEVGTIAPMAEIAARVRRRRGTLLHVDAVQAPGAIPLDVGALGADLVSLAGHKFEGPKGSGVLYLRQGTHILAQQHGGTQERYRRAGTENVAGAVGLATALDLAVREQPATAARLAGLRARLAAPVMRVPGVAPTGHPADRLPGMLSVVVAGVDGAEAVLALDLQGIAVSVGSACTTGSTEPSHVLTAMGYSPAEARGALRISLGRTTSDDDIDRAAEVIPATLARLRAAAPAIEADPLGERPVAEAVA